MVGSVGPRVRYLVAERGPAVVAVLLVVGLALTAGAVWTYQHPPRTEVTDHVDRQRVETTLSTSAEVTGNTSLYRSGTRLEDEPIYLLDAAPNATLAVTTDVPDGVETRVSQRVTLHLRGVHDGTAFWSDSRVLLDHTETTTGSVTSKTTLDVAALQRRVRAIEDELGGAGTVKTHLTVRVSHRTDRYDATLVERADLSAGSRWYEVGTPTLERTHSRPVSRSITLPDRDRTTYLLPGIAGAVALVGAVGVGVTYRRRYRGRDADDLALAVHRARYADWISRGTVPRDVGDRAVQMESLGDLVDVGIGAGIRTVYDPDRDVYVVLDGETAYFYDPFWDPGSDRDPLDPDGGEG